MKRIKSIFLTFLIFFLLTSFVVTCNFLLFFHWADMGREQIQRAAPITFANVVLLTIIFGTVDQVRRYYTVDRPIRQIQEGIRRIVAGDFKTRIPYVGTAEGKNDFNRIIYGLNQMAAELDGVETLRTDFISNVSHEMKTPLAVMQNYGTLLQAEDITPEQRREYADAIVYQTRRMSGLITNILKLNKLENQQISTNVTEYDLGEQLCQCLLDFEDQWEKKQIEIDADLPEGVFIRGDADMLALVWNNLLSNAIKFTEPGGIVRIVLRQDTSKVKVEVIDTGCGMNEETGKNIFNKFYQGDTSHSIEGNGLGLALVKRVVEIFGGEIRVSSKVGEGSIFCVILDRR